jgi:hypothetical protein
MRYFEINTNSQMSLVMETINLITASIDQLPINEEMDASYALQALNKLAKVATYLVQSKFKNAGDHARFEQFIVLVKGEVPNLTQAYNRMKLDTQNIATLNQRHQVFNR